MTKANQHIKNENYWIQDKTLDIENYYELLDILGEVNL